MKKKYSKPYLLKESFQLDTAVASCSGDGAVAFNYDSASCYADQTAELGGWFSDGACKHDAIYPNGDTNDQGCYHGVLAGMSFFAS